MGSLARQTDRIVDRAAKPASSVEPRLAIPVRDLPAAPDHALRTERLYLRPLTDADREEAISLMVDAGHAVSEFLPLAERGETPEEWFARERMKTDDGLLRGGAVRRGVFLLDKQEADVSNAGPLIGLASLINISRGLQWEADCVAWFGQRFQSRGFGTESLCAVIAHALAPLPDGLGLAAVNAGIVPGNTASEIAAARAGFKRDTGRECHLRVGDRWVKHEFWSATI
ncbi:MAG: GNAT family protein [Planctomycetota bacterium]